MLRACFDESVVDRPFKFFTVIGIDTFNLIRTLGDDGFYEEACGTILGFIQQNLGIQFPREVINGHKQILARLISRLPFQQEESLGIEVSEFPCIAPGFTLETFLNRLLVLGQTFEAALQCLESLIGAVARSKFLKLGAFWYGINRWPG